MIKKLTKIFLVFIFIGVFLLTNNFIEYILIDNTESFTRLMMHELYHPNENIDILFVGSSHAYRSINPDIIDEKTGSHSFCAGSSYQCLDGSLAVIKEANINNDLKEIYLELFWGITEEPQYKDRTEMTSTYIISDYMKPSLRRVNYLLNASSKEYWFNGFCPVRRYWKNIYDIDFIKETIAKKATDEYKQYKYPETEESLHYVSKGYVTTDEIMDDTNIRYYGCGLIDMDAIRGSDWEKSLMQIIDYCQKNNIKLTLFQAPIAEISVVGKQNHQEYNEYLQKIAEENQIEYYDFNLCRKQYFESSDRYFTDEAHLNDVGSEAFSNVMGEFIAGNIPSEKLFYDSVEDKNNEEETRVFGALAPNLNLDDIDTNELDIISNRNSGIKYRIIVTPYDGEPYFVQDYSENTIFSVEKGRHYTINVDWIENDDYENVHAIKMWL